jgi:hypothetical protein
MVATQFLKGLTEFVCNIHTANYSIYRLEIGSGVERVCRPESLPVDVRPVMNSPG